MCPLLSCIFCDPQTWTTHFLQCIDIRNGQDRQWRWEQRDLCAPDRGHHRCNWSRASAPYAKNSNGGGGILRVPEVPTTGGTRYRIQIFLGLELDNFYCWLHAICHVERCATKRLSVWHDRITSFFAPTSCFAFNSIANCLVAGQETKPGYFRIQHDGKMIRIANADLAVMYISHQKLSSRLRYICNAFTFCPTNSR